jgi:hypothetical protein
VSGVEDKMSPNSSRDDCTRRALHTDPPRIFEIRAAVRENRLSDLGLVTSADVAWFIDHGPIWVSDQPGAVAGFSARSAGRLDLGPVRRSGARAPRDRPGLAAASM